MRNFSSPLLATFLVTLSALAAQAATVTYSPTGPTLGSDDISNLVGTTTDAGNVLVTGVPFTTGTSNDAATYLGHDRGAIGQTFTTGAKAGGYTLSSFTLQTVNYSTFQRTSLASTITVRIGTFTDTTLTPTLTETLSVTGTELNQPANGTPVTGNGNYLTITLSTPIVLAANTSYFFDLAVTGGGQYFIETNGTNSGIYAGGTAYHTARLGGNFSGGTTTMIADTGDHVFDLALTAVPEPSTMALLVATSVGLLGFCRARKLRV